MHNGYIEVQQKENAHATRRCRRYKYILCKVELDLYNITSAPIGCILSFMNSTLRQTIGTYDSAPRNKVDGWSVCHNFLERAGKLHFHASIGALVLLRCVLIWRE